MVTIRGRDVDVGRFTYELIQLDMDALETYRIAAERIQDVEVRRRLEVLMRDHERHVSDLTPFVERSGRSLPPRSDVDLIRAKVTFDRLGGDRGILAGLKAMEDGTNLAYTQGCADPGVDDDVRSVLEVGLADERRHRAWLEEWLGQHGAEEDEEIDEIDAEDEDES